MTQPDGGMRWVIRIYLAIFLIYLLFPLLYMLLIAFNDSRIPTHRDFTFTLRWFGEAWADQRMWQGLRTSMLIGVVVIPLCRPARAERPPKTVPWHLGASKYLQTLINPD